MDGLPTAHVRRIAGVPVAFLVLVGAFFGAFLFGTQALSPTAAHAYQANCEVEEDGTWTCSEGPSGGGDGTESNWDTSDDGSYTQPGEVIFVDGTAPPAPPVDFPNLPPDPEPLRSHSCPPGRLCAINCPDGSRGLECPSGPDWDPILIPTPNDTDGLVSGCPLNVPLTRLAVCVRDRNMYARWSRRKIANLTRTCTKREIELRDLKRGRNWDIGYAERQRKIRSLEAEFGPGGYCEVFAGLEI